MSDSEEKFVPKTLAERLDAAQDGDQFGAVLMGLFGSLEKQMDAPKKHIRYWDADFNEIEPDDE